MNKYILFYEIHIDIFKIWYHLQFNQSIHTCLNQTGQQRTKGHQYPLIEL